MSDIATKPRTKVRLKPERPRLHKVILLNDDYTPREFVVTVLKGEFRMSEDQAYRVMMTAHRRGVCVVAVYTRDVAETKATRGTEAGRRKGYPLQFTTEPEEYSTASIRPTSPALALCRPRRSNRTNALCNGLVKSRKGRASHQRDAARGFVSGPRATNRRLCSCSARLHRSFLRIAR